MKVEGTGPSPLELRELPEGSRLRVRVLAGNLSNLRLGEQVRASVLGTTAASTLIELNGMKVVVEALPGLRPGENLSVRVARLFPQPLLEVGASAREPSVLLPPLEVGQEVTAKVVDLLPGGHLLINVKGTLLEAAAPQGLQVGSELLARVDQLNPQMVFRILDQGQGIEAETVRQAVRILRTHLPHQAADHSLGALRQELARLAQPTDPGAQNGLPSSLTKLQALMGSLLPDDALPHPERIASFVRDGGLFYESKLLQFVNENPQALARIADGDLKGLLLQALKEVGANPVHSEVQGLATSMANHLNHIEAQQAVNLLAQMNEGPYRLEIPFFSAWGLSTAFLSIEPDGRGAGEGKEGKEQGYNVLFLLDLEGFGHTRIDTHITAKTLRVIFYVEESGAVTLLRSELPSFRKTLQSLGYEEVFLAAEPFARLSPEKQERFGSLTVGVPTEVSLVDVRA